MQLEDREKKFIIVGVLFVIFLGGYYFIKYFKKNIKSSSSLIQEKQIERNTLEKIGKEYSNLKKYKVLKQNLDEMVPIIEQLLSKYELRDQISSLKPIDSSVDNNKYNKKTVSLRMKEVPAEPVLKFIKDIEENKSPPRMKIEKFSSRALVKEGYYAFLIKIVSYEKKGN